MVTLQRTIFTIKICQLVVEHIRTNAETKFPAININTSQIVASFEIIIFIQIAVIFEVPLAELNLYITEII